MSYNGNEILVPVNNVRLRIINKLYDDKYDKRSKFMFVNYVGQYFNML